MKFSVSLLAKREKFRVLIGALLTEVKKFLRFEDIPFKEVSITDYRSNNRD